MQEADAALVDQLAVLVVGRDHRHAALVEPDMALEQRQRTLADRAETNQDDGPVETGVNGPIGHTAASLNGARSRPP